MSWGVTRKVEAKASAQRLEIVTGQKEAGELPEPLRRPRSLRQGCWLAVPGPGLATRAAGLGEARHASTA